MGTLDELRARVNAQYDRLALRTWPNPHPQMPTANPEEYSRVTEPERYDIVPARAHSWTEALADLPGVAVEVLAPTPLDVEGRLRSDRGVRITCARAGALPLLLLTRDVPVDGSTGSLAVLHICVGRPEVCIAMLPDCGCDACDSGSEDLLTAVDDAIAQVVGGPFVALRGSGWYADWHPDGGRSGGDGRGPDHTAMLELCRRLAHGENAPLPRRTEAFVGRSWLD